MLPLTRTNVATGKLTFLREKRVLPKFLQGMHFQIKVKIWHLFLSMCRTEYKHSSFICCLYLADICLRMRRTGIQPKTTPPFAVVLLYLTCREIKSDICLRMRRTENKLPAVNSPCTVLKFFCAFLEGPEFSSKLLLFMLLYYCISHVWTVKSDIYLHMRRTENKLSAVHAACTVLMKSWNFPAHAQDWKSAYTYTSWHCTIVLTCQKPDICMRMRRTEDKLPAVPAAWTVLMKSDTCMRMRRTEDKLPVVPAAGSADGPDLDIWGGGGRAGPGTGLVRLPRPQHASGKQQNVPKRLIPTGFLMSAVRPVFSLPVHLHFPIFDSSASLYGFYIFIFSCFLPCWYLFLLVFLYV